MSVEEMPVGDFVRWLARKSDSSIIVSEELDKKTVSLDIRDQPIDIVLSIVARRLNVEMSRHGSLFFLGKVKTEDRSVLVRRIRRIRKSETTGAIRSVLSDRGKMQVLEDGLIVVSDRSVILVKVDEVIDAINSASSVAWAVQFHIVSLRERDIKDIGLDGVPALDLALTLSAASSPQLSLSTPQGLSGQANGILKAVLRAADERETVRVDAEPLMLLVDGSEGKITRGRQIPIPKQELSQEGRVSTKTFTQVQAGFSLKVSARELSDELCRLKINLKISDVVGFRGDAPELSNQELEQTSDIANGGVFLIGSLRRLRKDNSRKSWLSYGKTDKIEEDVLLVFARAYRVEMKTKKEPLAKSHTIKQAVLQPKLAAVIAPKKSPDTKKTVQPEQKKEALPLPVQRPEAEPKAATPFPNFGRFEDFKK